MFRRILLATDGSGNAQRATRAAIELARRNGAQLLVVYAIPPQVVPGSAGLAPPIPSGTFGAAVGEYYTRSRDEAGKLIRQVADLAKQSEVDARGEVLDAHESVVEQLVDFAKNEKVDLIVAGTRGLSRFRKLLLGSVSAGLVTHAHCAVLIVR